MANQANDGSLWSQTESDSQAHQNEDFYLFEDHDRTMQKHYT